ncbi:MAG TPA: MopE-related protein [Kofleriaceae bacterium]|nr:MopE-related protein [Kofleriaceae bacterium]
MKTFIAWLGAATLAVVATPARAGEPLKPYVVLAVDTSGSMNESTGAGAPSCGGSDTKLNHARCAINRIVNSYGDMVFGLGRFRMQMGGTFPSCTLSGAGTAGTSTCNTSTDMFELLAPLVDGENQLAATWTNGTINTCTANGTDPELWGATGNTPLEGTLRGAKSYWQGAQAQNFTIWPSGLPGFAPIANDPTNTAFLPKIGKPATCNPNPATCDNSASCTSATNCCCLEQCRPYVVILLTDGAETCTGDPALGAASLLATDVSNRRYRVETKPIGFGIAAGNSQIESIAHAGGAADLPGINEGFYAQNEADLQLAISSILDDAIKTESCNNADDDCDTAIDEDFPGKNGTCDNGKLGACRRTGTLVCKADGTGLQCNAPDASGSNETCNNVDDDCDGKVDEGLVGCSCTPQGEQCNNADDDCDGNIDEGITRPCGTGTCQGTETCVAGVFTGCTAQQPSSETCNGLDDNCDGVRDGFTEACSNMTTGFPAGDPRNNPGDPSHNPIAQNICHPGQRTCPANVGPPNSFGSCLGEQQPRTEVCNNLDDDCDNKIDEGTGGADCSSNCGVGTTVCVNGQIECNSVVQPNDDSCDGNDDDCDGQIDEDWVCDNPPNCGCTAPNECNAVQSCVGGQVVCSGQSVAQESCNCDDDDCDTKVDEGSLCGAGSECKFCQCAAPCSTNSEFPCPMGKTCKEGVCIVDPCFGVDCPAAPNGSKQVCQVAANGLDHTCVDACSVTQCPTTFVCIPSTGECKPDDCTTFPDRCAANQVCINGVCETNLCSGVNCPSDQYCVAGQCYSSCADVECANNQRCELGKCIDDPCGGKCTNGQVCNDNTGTCTDDNCGDVVRCPQGQWCNPHNNGGTCEDDPCVGTACPGTGQVCIGGTCYDPNDFVPDGGVPVRVTTGGGGGCSTGGGAGLGVALALLVLARKRGGRS